jgi:hypothetical protein
MFDWVKHHFLPTQHNAYRPHLLRRGPLLFLLIVCLFAEGVLVFNLMLRNAGHDYLAAVVQSELISLTNQQRAVNKASTLSENTLLNQSAQAKAEDMAARGYFAHVGPDGKNPWAWIDAMGYDYQYAGENLAVRFVDSKDVVAGWMASPTHRANMVKSVYTEIGVGIAQGVYKGQPATFVVQHFAKPSVKALAARQQGRVLGAEIAAPPASLGDSIARQAGKALSEPRETTAWILGFVSALLALTLALTFMHHIQIQSRDLLVPGTIVAGVALSFIFLNAAFLSEGAGTSNQAAGVATYEYGVVISGEAASTER